MASTTICTPCLRALRANARAFPKHLRQRNASRLWAVHRAFTTTHPSHNEQEPRTPPPPKPFAPSSPSSPSSFANLASTLRTNKALRSTTEPYVAYGTTEDLYHLCAAPLSYTIPARNATPPAPAPTNAAGEDVGVPDHPRSFWFRPRTHGGLGMDVTFANWSQIIFLHMYILTVRLRTFPAEHARIWHQQLLDHFFYAAEDRMAAWHGISARSVRNKYLKDLWNQWRGVIFSYDEGLVNGDAVLAGAVWRNVFKGDMETDVEDLAKVVAFLRRELRAMERVTDEELAAGRVGFGDPGEVGRTLEKKSGWMERRFEEAEAEVGGQKGVVA